MRVTPITASTILSDGGTIFGIIPKVLWSKKILADERNQVALTANVLLVELDDGRHGLVDLGCGSPAAFSEKERKIHGLGERWLLPDRLREAGVSPARIEFVALTHLHWDHAGGAVKPDEENIFSETFPNAVFHINRKEWEDAFSGDPLFFRAYPEATLSPFRRLPPNRLHLADDDEEVLPGVRLIRSGGHTRGHSVIMLQSSRLELNHPQGADFKNCPYLVFAGDVVATRHHLRMVSQMSFDFYPLDTRAWKRKWLPAIARDSAMLCFEHDPDLFGATLRADDREEFVVDRGLSAKPQ